MEFALPKRIARPRCRWKHATLRSSPHSPAAIVRTSQANRMELVLVCTASADARAYDAAIWMDRVVLCPSGRSPARDGWMIFPSARRIASDTA
jgi:hypothetical protein